MQSYTSNGRQREPIGLVKNLAKVDKKDLRDVFELLIRDLGPKHLEDFLIELYLDERELFVQLKGFNFDQCAVVINRLGIG